MKILLVHNPLSWHPLYWFSFLIRILTCSRYNHAALLLDGAVWEAQADGIRCTEYGEWKNKTERLVLPLSVDLAHYKIDPKQLAYKLELSKPYQYGYFDIIPFFFRVIVQYRWFGKKQRWTGKTIMEGYFCSEFVAWALDLEEAHLYSPEALQHLPGLTPEQEYSTGK
jgi:hypothetical protein